MSSVQEPDGWAVVMEDGAFVGIWRSRESAEHIRDRSPRTKAERVEPMIFMNRVNTPEIDNFMSGVRLEAAHQVQRWGTAHDRDKSAENWYWLVGYLAGKALRAAITGDREKALHHCISSAAALLQWHRAISRDTSGAGVGEDADLLA